FADARSDEEREITGQRLDAFHKTFNFCMTCRQYTCGNCWNDVENRCLTCVPHVGHEIMPAAFPNLQARLGMAQIETAAAGNGNGHVDAPVVDPAAWPSIHLRGPASAAENAGEEEPAAEAEAICEPTLTEPEVIEAEPAATFEDIEERWVAVELLAEPDVDLLAEPIEASAEIEATAAPATDEIVESEAVSGSEAIAQPE